MSPAPPSDRPFVDRPVGDVASAERLAHRAATAWRLPRPELLRVGMNALFTAGDVVIRVGTPTGRPDASAELAMVLHEHGLVVPEPVAGASVRDGELVATAWHRIEPSPAPVDWHDVGRQVRAVHDLDPAHLPDGYPLADPTRFPWWDFEAQLAAVADLLDAPAAAGLRRAIDRRADWQQLVGVDRVVCHGDVHPGNVMMSDAGAVLLDWDLLCSAHPAWDHAMLAGFARRWGGSPDVYRRFTAGYGATFDDDEVLAAIRDLRDVAAVLMRVRAGRTDEAARREADRRLDVYRGVPDPPVWRAQ